MVAPGGSAGVTGVIWAARHPRPAVAEGICYGRLDVSLAEPAAIGARRILQQLDGQPARIVTSPLRRAHDIASHIAAETGIALLVEPRLAELDFGAWEGVAWSDIARREIDAWAADPLGYRPGGGECVTQLSRRVAELWQEAPRFAEPQLWLTHAGPLRCLAALSRNVPLSTCLNETFAYSSVLVLAPAAPV